MLVRRYKYILRRVLNFKVTNRQDMLTFALTCTFLGLAIVALVEIPVSAMVGETYMQSIVRGWSVSLVAGLPILWLISFILLQNGKLAHRYRKALQLANRHAKNLIKKNKELEAAKLQLVELANSDFLTGLANRRRFQDVLEHSFSEAQTGHRTFSLHVLDLDAFKTVNDTHGHDAGDAILRHTSVRIRKALVDRDGLAARLGGDEFAVILWDTDDHDIEQFTKELNGLIVQPHGYQGEVLKVSATIGSALYRDDYSSAEEMFILTDRRLIAMKQQRQDARANAHRQDTHPVAV